MRGPGDQHVDILTGFALAALASVGDTRYGEISAGTDRELLFSVSKSGDSDRLLPRVVAPLESRGG